jgi:Tol biopolymer transport system component
MINEEPDLSLKSKYFKGVEPKILKDIQENNLAFTRSGLHCDLHPRWDKKGEKVAFDSIHEGSRQIYMIDIDALKVIN